MFEHAVRRRQPSPYDDDIPLDLSSEYYDAINWMQGEETVPTHQEQDAGLAEESTPIPETTDSRNHQLGGAVGRSKRHESKAASRAASKKGKPATKPPPPKRLRKSSSNLTAASSTSPKSTPVPPPESPPETYYPHLETPKPHSLLIYESIDQRRLERQKQLAEAEGDPIPPTEICGLPVPKKRSDACATCGISGEVDGTKMLRCDGPR